MAKIKKIEDFNNINNIDDFKELINKICFLDDTLSSVNTYFYSMYIFYLALMNVFKEKINPDEIYECLKQRFLVDFENLTNSYTKVDRLNEVTIFTQTDILREFIPFLKLKLAETNQSFTYYPGFRYEELEKYFPAELLKEIKKFFNFKIKFLNEISKLLASYLAQIIKEF